MLQVNPGVAIRIAKKITQDLAERGELGDVWDTIEDDMQEEIIDDWAAIIVEETSR
jgi:hypothetical protein